MCVYLLTQSSCESVALSNIQLDWLTTCFSIVYSDKYILFTHASCFCYKYESGFGVRSNFEINKEGLISNLVEFVSVQSVLVSGLDFHSCMLCYLSQSIWLFLYAFTCIHDLGESSFLYSLVIYLRVLFCTRISFYAKPFSQVPFQFLDVLCIG